MNTTMFGTPTTMNKDVVDVTILLRHKLSKLYYRVKDKIMGQSASRLLSSSSNDDDDDDNNNNITWNVSPPIVEEDISSIVALGAGCFWGTEKYVSTKFQEQFPNSIQSCTVGFMALPGSIHTIHSPTYKQVCNGTSGKHVEVVYIVLNEPKKHFEELVRYFFQFHDPTTFNKQGNDIGYQYSSCIYCNDTVQYNIACRVRTELQIALKERYITHCYNGNKIVTQIVSKIYHFTPAEKIHQKYLEKNPNGYCNHRIRFKYWPTVNNNNKMTASTSTSTTMTTTTTATMTTTTAPAPATATATATTTV